MPLKQLSTKSNVVYYNVSFAIVKAPKPNTNSVAADVPADSDKWENVDNAKSVTYTVVPISAVDDAKITDIGKQQIKTDATAYNNLNAYNDENGNIAKYTDPATGLELKHGKTLAWTDSHAFSVKGIYKNKTVTIPGDWYSADTASGSAFTITTGSAISCIHNVRAGELLWGELYDENSNKGTRIDAIKRLVLKVKGNAYKDQIGTVTAKVAVSDAKAAPSDIRFKGYGWQWDITEITFRPSDTKLESAGVGFDVLVLDQYGKEYKENSFNGWDSLGQYGNFLEYTVSDKNEITSEFTHLSDSFKVSGNGSTGNKLKITGAELGDTYTLTATIPDTNISKSIKVTVGADQKAFMANGNDSDKTFRTNILGYKK